MGDAFDGLDTYCWASADGSDASPDGVHDWIFMMHEDDWSALRDAWGRRPAAWRQACAYVLGFGSPDDCVPLLATAVFDDDLDVALEAAIGYAVQVLEQDRLAAVTPPLRERLAHLVAEARGQHVDEVVDLLRRLGAK